MLRLSFSCGRLEIGDYVLLHDSWAACNVSFFGYVVLLYRLFVASAEKAQIPFGASAVARAGSGLPSSFVALPRWLGLVQPRDLLAWPGPASRSFGLASSSLGFRQWPAHRLWIRHGRCTQQGHLLLLQLEARFRFALLTRVMMVIVVVLPPHSRMGTT